MNDEIKRIVWSYNYYEGRRLKPDATFLIYFVLEYMYVHNYTPHFYHAVKLNANGVLPAKQLKVFISVEQGE